VSEAANVQCTYGYRRTTCTLQRDDNNAAETAMSVLRKSCRELEWVCAVSEQCPKLSTLGFVVQLCCSLYYQMGLGQNVDV